MPGHRHAPLAPPHIHQQLAAAGAALPRPQLLHAQPLRPVGPRRRMRAAGRQGEGGVQARCLGGGSSGCHSTACLCSSQPARAAMKHALGHALLCACLPVTGSSAMPAQGPKKRDRKWWRLPSPAGWCQGRAEQQAGMQGASAVGQRAAATGWSADSTAAASRAGTAAAPCAVTMTPTSCPPVCASASAWLLGCRRRRPSCAASLSPASTTSR